MVVVHVKFELSQEVVVAVTGGMDTATILFAFLVTATG